jgi:putative Holliday junction resolvase
LLGVDYGNVRVGLAVSDVDRLLASPLSTHHRGTQTQDAAYFQRLVAEETIGQLVVGLPVHLSGQEGEKAREARAFGLWLCKTTDLPVVFWDERFTTVEAEAALLAARLTSKRRKARRDQVAAQIMLQSYLDAGCPAQPTIAPLDEAESQAEKQS